MPPVIGNGPGRCPPAGRVLPTDRTSPMSPSVGRPTEIGPVPQRTSSSRSRRMMRADVEKDEAAAQLARQASEALAGLLEHERTQPPDGDRFDRCSETLDELARALMTIVAGVEHRQ